MAKYEGGYTNIEGGIQRYAFEFLLGTKSKVVKCGDIEKRWDEILNNLNDGDFLTASSKTKKGTTDKDASPNGIFFGHAYSVLNLEEHKPSGLKLILLRNPWGRGEWKGDYSDNDPKWTPELCTHLKKTASKDNGVFFMTIEDFENEFESLDIAEF